MQAFAAGQVSNIPINEVANTDIPIKDIPINNGVPAHSSSHVAGSAGPTIGDLRDLITSVKEVLVDLPEKVSQHAIDAVKQANALIGALPTDGLLGTSVTATAGILKYVDESIALQLKAGSGAVKDDVIQVIRNATDVIHFADNKINTEANAVSSLSHSYYVCF